MQERTTLIWNRPQSEIVDRVVLAGGEIGQRAPEPDPEGETPVCVGALAQPRGSAADRANPYAQQIAVPRSACAGGGPRQGQPRRRGPPALASLQRHAARGSSTPPPTRTAGRARPRCQRPRSATGLMQDVGVPDGSSARYVGRPPRSRRRSNRRRFLETELRQPAAQARAESREFAARCPDSIELGSLAALTTISAPSCRLTPTVGQAEARVGD